MLSAFGEGQQEGFTCYMVLDWRRHCSLSLWYPNISNFCSISAQNGRIWDPGSVWARAQGTSTHLSFCSSSQLAGASSRLSMGAGSFFLQAQAQSPCWGEQRAECPLPQPAPPPPRSHLLPLSLLPPSSLSPLISGIT